MCHFPLSVIQPLVSSFLYSACCPPLSFASSLLPLLPLHRQHPPHLYCTRPRPSHMSTIKSQTPPPSTASPPLPTTVQDQLPPNSPISKVSNPLSRASERPRDFISLTHFAPRLAQSSPFNRSPQSSPSRAVTNDSPDDFQTNAASLLAPTHSAQSDSTTPPNVYINGLPPNFPEEQLYNMTKEFGAVLSVRTFTRHVSERPT